MGEVGNLKRPSSPPSLLPPPPPPPPPSAIALRHRLRSKLCIHSLRLSFCSNTSSSMDRLDTLAILQQTSSHLVIVIHFRR